MSLFEDEPDNGKVSLLAFFSGLLIVYAVVKELAEIIDGDDKS